MSMLNIDLPDDTHARLREFAADRGVTLDRLVNELFASVLAQKETADRFQERKRRGSKAQLIRLLDKLDAPDR